MDEKQLSEQESLNLIAQMISKAKNSYYDTGLSAMMWGAVIVICSLEKIAELHFSYKLPFDIYLLTFAAIIPQIYINVKENKERKAVAYDDIYMRYVWLAFGISIALLIVINNAVFAGLTEMKKNIDPSVRIDWTAFKYSEYVSSLFLLLYGLPTFITGAACKFRPMFWGSLLCWASCIVALFTDIKIDLLLTALSAFFAWFIPGIMMQRDYRKAKKGLTQADV